MKIDSPNLDFLRANAVLMVLVFHVLGFFGIRRAGPFDLEAMGLLGVLLFFVHTGFVLMLSLERQTAKLGQQRMFWIFMSHELAVHPKTGRAVQHSSRAEPYRESLCPGSAVEPAIRDRHVSFPASIVSSCSES